MAARIRCAIYTRKSTEEGLEQEFNSLDAQREACAAYILSQRSEGWAEVKDHYDDGGISGGTMERVGLQRLLADVEAGRVDVIVVYKVDRLTRSLADFARIVDVLDKRGASFVSVTQAFNTTTSMGRLTLNVLLSFAQFEREVTGERIRDKIAASKAKGMWMGGNVSLGYAVEDRRLVVVPEDAAMVRHIFTRYLALGSGQKLVGELHEQGYRTRIRVTRGGPRGGVSFQRGPLFALLSNRIYRGEIVHKGAVYPGDHEAIIDPELWDKVQALITHNRVEHRLGTRTANPSLLTGIITDGRGRRMSPSHTKKGARRYRYYVTHMSACIEEGPPAWRMPALETEAAVVRRLQLWLQDRRAIRDMLPDDSAVEELERVIAMAARAASRMEDPSHRRRIVSQAVGAVQVEVDHLRITLNVQGLSAVFRRQLDPAIAAPVLTASGTRVRQGRATKLVFAGDDGCATEVDPALIRLLREAQEARAAMVRFPTLSVSQIAQQRKVCRHRLRRVIKLSWLAPDIITAIVEGRHPASLTAKRLLEADLPVDWAGQKRMLGFA